MSLMSMTGFARTRGEAEWGSWVWEAKSVNGKGADIRLNLPNGFDQLDRPVKAKASGLFSRGTVNMSLRYDLSSGEQQLTLNEAMLDQLVAAFETRTGHGPNESALATLIAVPGVVDRQGGGIKEVVANKALLSAIEQTGLETLQTLHDDRAEEGAKLLGVLTQKLAELKTLAAQAASRAEAQTMTVQTRYRTRLAEFDAENIVSEERIATEVATLSAKADVQEELDRLDAHIAKAQALLEDGGAIGRNLGFLVQELNREANTLCAKSADLDLTETGLALKGVIDQFKEQAANVE